MMKKEEIKTVLVQLLTGMVIGLSFTVVIIKYDGLFFSGYWMNIAVMALLFAVVYFIELIFHEAGHLLFGVMSGYKFLSFRIFDIVLIKNDGKLKIKRMKLANTLGQCLLIPPAYSDDYPFVFYNLGGVIINCLTGILGLILSLIVKNSYIALNSYLFFICGIAQALTNGIPMKVGSVANDGYNIRYFKANPAAKRAFHLQLQVNALQSEGIRIKDMDPKIFEIEDDEMCIVSLLKEGYFMDSHKFEEAKSLIESLLDNKKMIDLYKILLKFDLYTCNVLLEDKRDDSIFENKQAKAIIKSMPNYPSVVRTLIAKDGYDEKLVKRMEKHPIESEIISEMEIINLLKDKMIN